MQTRVAIISIIVEDNAIISDIQKLLSQYAPHIIGRFGIPHKQKEVRIISVVLDAPVDVINALAAALAQLEHVSTQTLLSNV